MLARAVDDRPHALLDGPILLIDSLDAGEGLGLLDLPVDHPAIGAVPYRPEAIVHVDELPVRIPALAVREPRRHVLAAVAVIEIPDHAVLVVHRDPIMSVDLFLVRSRRAKRRERHDEMVAPDVLRLGVQRPDTEVGIAVVGEVDLERRGTAFDAGAVDADARMNRILLERPVEDGEVRGVDPAFQRLEPVALLHAFAHGDVRLGILRPIEPRRRWLSFLGPHVSPNDAAELHRWIGRNPHLGAERLRLVHLLDALARPVELPAVEDAPQTVGLVAPQPQRRAAVRTKFLHDAHLPVAGPKSHQVLAQETHAHGRAVRLRKLPGKERRHPISAHGLAHRGAGADSGQLLVFFLAEHRVLPFAKLITTEVIDY